MGGWAVHATVDARYRMAKGRGYLGSKDIDLGLHFEGDEGAEAVRGSALARTVRSLEGIGYEGTSFRMAKYYHRDTRRPLTGDEASRVPLYDMFAMYVDLMVDNIPAGAKDALGFVPADEKAIGHALVRGMSDEIDRFGARILLPRPEVLLAAKISSMPRRSEDHKRFKDIADMYALVWYAGVESGDLVQSVAALVPQARLQAALDAISARDYEQAAAALDADAAHVRAVLAGFLGGGGRPAEAEAEAEAAEAAARGRPRTPSATTGSWPSCARSARRRPGAGGEPAGHCRCRVGKRAQRGDEPIVPEKRRGGMRCQGKEVRADGGGRAIRGGPPVGPPRPDQEGNAGGHHGVAPAAAGRRVAGEARHADGRPAAAHQGVRRAPGRARGGQHAVAGKHGGQDAPAHARGRRDGRGGAGGRAVAAADAQGFCLEFMLAAVY